MDGRIWSPLVESNRFICLLQLCDTSLDHLGNSALVAYFLEYNHELNHGDAINFIDGSHDIYYLDGGNDPRETEAQLEKIVGLVTHDIYVLIDDFKIKGTSINMEKYPFVVHNIEQGLGVLHFSEKNNG